jgi:two-component system sensor kinase FixL
MAARRPVTGDVRLAATATPFHDALLAQLPGLVWAVDADLCCRIASVAADSRLGLRVDDPIAARLPAGEGTAAFLDAHRRALAGASARSTLTLSDSSFSCRVEPLRAADGEVIGALGSAVETTERDRAARVVETQLAVFAATLEHAPQSIVICDQTGRFLYANAAAQRLSERSPEGTTIADGPAVWGLWRDDRGPVALDDWPIADALRGDVIQGREAHKVLPDGSRLHIQFSAAPLRDAGGAIIGAAATGVDITARKQAEQQVNELNQELERRVQARTAEIEEAIEARDREGVERQRAMELLARSEQLLSDIVNHSTAVIFLKDLDGRYLLINAHYERLFGVNRAEWVGRTDHEIFPSEVAERLHANDRRVLESGAPLHVEEVVPTQGRDRTYISVKFPLRDRGGSLYGIGGMATDITEMKEMEAALRRSEATLAAVIESSSDPICALNRERQLVAINAAATRLIPTLLGSLPSMQAPIGGIPEDFAGEWRQLVLRGMAGERFTVERALSIDGVTRHFLVSFNPTVQDGAVTGVAIFGREITELKRAEEEARQHQAELAHVLRRHTMGEMAASLAHEVNQPLGAIANYAQGCRNRLRNGRVEPGELLATVEEIAREALRAGEITRRVRELLRKEEPQRTTVDAARIVDAALGIVAAAARREHVALSSRIAATPLLAHLDPIQIEQVVVNLLLNAIEATSACATRVVEVCAAAAAPPELVVEIAVSDTGAGIDPGLAQRMFEPFVTTKSSGLGMGLAISRSIVAAHGGRLWYTPNEDGGTTFHFTLPVAPRD